MKNHNTFWTINPLFFHRILTDEKKKLCSFRSWCNVTRNQSGNREDGILLVSKIEALKETKLSNNVDLKESNVPLMWSLLH